MIAGVTDLKAVIFDMDGVLLLSTPCHATAFAEVLAPHGITDLDYASIAGMRTDEAFQKIFAERQRDVSSSLLKELVAQKQKRVLELLTEHPPIAPGSQELMTLLQKKYRLALVSSGSAERIELFLRHSGYRDAFACVVDGGMVERAKPAPDMYCFAAEQLGLAPTECMVVEDALNGVESARNAGMSVVAITQDQPDQFKAAGAWAVVPAVADVGRLLQEQG